MDKSTFKRLLSLLETSGGTQMDHNPVDEGMHAGTSAIGEYGMMPKTIQDLAKSNPQKTELDKIIQGADPTSVDEILQSNPDKYNQYANQMSDKVAAKSKGDAEDAAMRWLAGQNSSSRRIASVSDDNPGRVAKIDDFMKGSQQIQPTFTEQLMAQQPPKEVLYNKIRQKLGRIGGM